MACNKEVGGVGWGSCYGDSEGDQGHSEIRPIRPRLNTPTKDRYHSNPVSTVYQVGIIVTHSLGIRPTLQTCCVQVGIAECSTYLSIGQYGSIVSIKASTKKKTFFMIRL